MGGETHLPARMHWGGLQPSFCSIRTRPDRRRTLLPFFDGKLPAFLGRTGRIAIPLRSTRFWRLDQASTACAFWGVMDCFPD
jgi:hypothetical protein